MASRGEPSALFDKCPLQPPAPNILTFPPSPLPLTFLSPSHTFPHLPTPSHTFPHSSLSSTVLLLAFCWDLDDIHHLNLVASSLLPSCPSISLHIPSVSPPPTPPTPPTPPSFNYGLCSNHHTQTSRQRERQGKRKRKRKRPWPWPWLNIKRWCKRSRHVLTIKRYDRRPCLQRQGYSWRWWYR